MRRLLAHRDARLLLAGETLSMFGSWALLFVLAMWVKDLTGSNGAAGMVFFVLALPGLAAPLGGFVVDRFPRRRVLIATDLATAAAVLLLLFVHGREQLWLLYAVAAAYGASVAVFGSGLSALLRVMLPDDLLPHGNAAFQTVRQGLRLVAPLAGAALYVAVGGASVAVIDAATYIVSAGCILALGVREPKPPPPELRFFGELAAGARHILATKPLARIVFGVAFGALVFGFAETVIFAVVDEGLHRPTSFLSVLASLQGVGSIVGGLTAAALLRRLGDARLVGVGLALFAFGDGLLVAPTLPTALLGFAIAGVGISWAVVAFGTAVQRRSPGHLQGRVYSAADTLMGAPQTFSIALGAGLSTLVDFRVLVVTMAVVTTAAAAYLVTTAEPAEASDAEQPTGGRLEAAPPVETLV